MRTLAIETATEACSVALFEGDSVIAAEHRVLGRGHAEQLVPMIRTLPDRGRAERILVSLGPGSFTGVRIGIATARALAIAWQAEILGYPTLALIAAISTAARTGPVTVCMAGGHGEWLLQDFDADGAPEGVFASLAPDAAIARGSHANVAGSKAVALARVLPSVVSAQYLLPDAREVLLLPAGALTRAITPIYARPPDARLPT